MTSGLRERKREQVRHAITRAALTLWADNDVDEVTVERIAAEANVSTRTFFNYFPSKEDVLSGPSADEAADFVDRVLAQPDSQSAVEALAAVIGEDLTRMSDQEEDWTLWSRAISRNPQLLPRLLVRLGETEHQYAVAVAARTHQSPDALHPRLVAGCVLTVLRAAFAVAIDGDSAARVREAFAAGLASVLGGLADPQ